MAFSSFTQCLTRSRDSLSVMSYTWAMAQPPAVRPGQGLRVCYCGVLLREAVVLWWPGPTSSAASASR